MNSYPLELLVQLAPVMFVAGLEAPAQGKPPEAFGILNQRLHEALLSQRKPTVWHSEKTKTFHVVIVDKDVRFPPRKSVPPDDPHYPSSHSPLSPLTPSSPLHPDGLIAPIWIRKHNSLLPSVFVLFLRMYETPLQDPRSPLDVSDREHEREREQEERKRDSELAAEISIRKKSTNERGIKLTVVLIASRRMLDDPTLDTRLTFIRRQSGLDSRAALFVLSPVSPTELGEFISSLQQALYEPAIDYYTAHSKRVRRKRNRHSQAVTSYTLPTTNTNIARPLRPEGWTVRYEYKMGCFAEFRGENDVALKHYQDAYETLAIMFGSTIILPPRTKRWAEAKVLSDCINLKIAKLYLYNNEHALALSHHSMHMRKFGDFSRGWGIGEETFEYWSWMARQHRVFAELIEQGSHSTLNIPVPKPPPLGNASSLAAIIRGGSAPSLELDALRSLGSNPNHTLQHSGYYYYMAARCTESRKERFQAAVNAEQPILSPGFANEKKVQHYAIILELYTKAYEIFKKHTSTATQNQAQSRQTLWIAYRIAQTYYESGDYKTAVRFFERIAKTYRREKWTDMLRPLLSTWYECARQLGDVELGIRLLLEMMGYGSDTPDYPDSLQGDLVLILKSTVPSSLTGVLTVDLLESQPIFDSNVVFWKPQVEVGELVAFQISLAAPATTSLSSTPFSSLEIYLSQDKSPIIIRHSASTDTGVLDTVDLGDVTAYRDELTELTTNLRWQPGGVLVLYGRIKSDVPAQLKVERLVLTITWDAWTIRIPLESCRTRPGAKPSASWLCSIDPPRFILVAHEDPSSSLIVKHRPHNVGLSLSHQAPAYLDEEYPIQINVTNEDVRDLDIVVDVLLLPSEYDESVSVIVVDNERSPSLIKGIPFGTLRPGENSDKTLVLVNSGLPVDRALDICVRSCPPRDDVEQAEESTDALEDRLQNDTTETLHTLVVPTVEPFEMHHDLVYSRGTEEFPGLTDSRTFDGDYWDNRGGQAIINFRVECSGPWPIEIDGIVLEREDSVSAKIVDSALDFDADAFPSEFIPGDDYNDVCRISIAYPYEDDVEHGSIPRPGRYIIQWRRIMEGGHRGPLTTTTYYLPTLQPPLDGLIALLKVPPMMTLHRPTPLVLLIRNYNKERSANITVHLENDGQDGFVVAGLRNGRLPVLLPGAEEKIVWQLVPLECGYLKLPNIRVVDRRRTLQQSSGGEAQTEGEAVRVVDIRIDQRRVSTAGSGEIQVEDDNHTILVLPK